MSEMSPVVLQMFIDKVFDLTRIRMNESKRALIVNRLSRRLAELKLPDFKTYYDYLSANRGEVQKFVDAVTTNETSFFRSPKVWEYFANTFLPSWASRNKGGRLAMWCAASSSGEEPYTIAMLCEDFAEKTPGFQWALKASDISEEMLSRARAGEYPECDVKKIDVRLARKFFEPTSPGALRAKEMLRRKIGFFRHKLQDLPSESGLEAVFLRNVLIYFDTETKEAVLKNVAKALKPGGLLVVGESEGLVNVKSEFKYSQPSIYFKEGEALGKP